MFFGAGVLVTVLLAVLLANLHTIIALFRARMPTSHGLDAAPPAPGIPTCNSPATRREKRVARPESPKKPFELRPRLTHEPPELDYTWYECFSEVQAEFKALGRDLEWRTGFLDNHIESTLLLDYGHWASTNMTVANEAFHAGLVKNLDEDLRDVHREEMVAAERFGMGKGDYEQVMEIIRKVRRRREAR